MIVKLGIISPNRDENKKDLSCHHPENLDVRLFHAWKKIVVFNISQMVVKNGVAGT